MLAPLQGAAAVFAWALAPLQGACAWDVCWCALGSLGAGTAWCAVELVPDVWLTDLGVK